MLEVDEQANATLPGAGLGKIVPYETVLKDGFYATECVADYMFSFGDKFGDGHFSYELESVSNVSIVHYSVVVPEEDREKMTHTVCFSFCRTVPDMLFFGIRNGYECYCAPYYKPIADDSSMCDQACEGDQTQACGGKSKSSVFAMHMCDTLVEDLAAATEKLSSVKSDLEGTGEDINALSQELQSGADALQKTFQQAGDPTASDLMQTAKAFAGELEKEGVAVTGLVEVITETNDKARHLDVTTKSFGAIHEAEKVLAKMEHFTVVAEEKVEEMEAFTRQTNISEVVEGAAEQYYSVLYFVDKEHAADASTCGGTAVGQPILGSVDACASACDADVHSCVGFSYFKNGESGICFLLAKFKTVTYFTGCGGSSEAAFLQESGANATQCKAKVSKFEGTSLKPDASGKCEQCFKEATDAARCFE